jgi:uncharacterized coiled-coil protein SlyX
LKEIAAINITLQEQSKLLQTLTNSIAMLTDRMGLVQKDTFKQVHTMEELEKVTCMIRSIDSQTSLVCLQ